MTTLRDVTIDLNNLKEEDKYLRRISGDMLSIQLDSPISLTVKGSHKNFDEGNMYPLAIINMTTLAKSTTINEAGVYNVMISGIDEIELEMSGSGKLHIKELGE